MGRKKGQFFIIGSVIVLMVLYNIIGVLNSNWQTDVSEVQGSEAAQIFKNIESGINRTIRASDNSSIERNLETFVLVERNAIGDSYNLHVLFNITQTDVIANMTLSSKKFYADKPMVFKRN